MARFDLAALHEAVDAERLARSLSWAAVGRDVRVSASTIRRFAVAADAEADGVLALVRWLGVPPEQFVVGAERAGEPLPADPAVQVRVDMAKVAASTGDRRGAEGRTRTTIQRLVAAASSADSSIAALTRTTTG